jgi:hypothetical protein
MRIGKLLLSLIPCLLGAPALAATINLSPGQDVAGAMGAAHSGDTVIFGSGTFDINSPVTIPSGVTVTGLSPELSHINFNLAGGDQTSYGFLIAGNASNTTIEQLDMYSNHGVIQLSLGDPYTDSYQNILITRNNLQYGGGQLSDGSLVYGISVTMTNNGLKITHNYFHDSPNAVRNWCIFYANNASLDYNVFYNIEDGGQIQYPLSNVSFSYNYGTRIHRMGQESHTAPQSSVNFVGNVFYDWENPYPDSTGISIVGAQSGQVNFQNNYFRSSIAPGSGWGPPDGSGVNRFGFVFEATGYPCNVTGNTFVGVWAACVCSQSTNTNVWDNTVYGEGLWGNYDGQDGGAVNQWNNSSQSQNNAPQPPANTFAGPQNPVEEATSSTSPSGTSTAPAKTQPSTPAATPTTTATATSSSAPTKITTPSKATTPAPTTASGNSTDSADGAQAASLVEAERQEKAAKAAKIAYELKAAKEDKLEKRAEAANDAEAAKKAKAEKLAYEAKAKKEAKAFKQAKQAKTADEAQAADPSTTSDITAANN